MPIRGERNPLPKKGGAPSGIFSTNGSQKKDPVTADHVGLMKANSYGGGGETENKPTSGRGQSTRHQKHYGKKY